jgi:hypothetical protein
MKDSAAATCFWSSRVTRRTKTFVSTARMLVFHVAQDAFIEVSQLPRLRSAFGKDRSVDILRGVPTGFANDDCIAFLIPFQNRAWTDTELSSHFGGNRNLTLGCNL